MKLFVVEIRAFGKHIVERVEADSREEAQTKMMHKWGIYVTAQPA